MMRWYSLLAACVALALAPRMAAAQGTCRCNNGCHNQPGQCVLSGSNGCAPGYAPFCETRTESCPRTGWVSCSGGCTCTRIPGFDAGTPLDAPRVDAPVSLDAPTTADVPPRIDGPPVSDTPPGPDVPRPDGATPPDAPVGVDAPVSVDGPARVDAPVSLPDGTVTVDAASPDAPATTDGGPVDDLVTPADGGCVCPGGICYRGVCVRDRCEYQAELGFVCLQPGQRCVEIGGDPWCVPGCLGVTCEMGAFCDEGSGLCEHDNCASMRCPAGQVCAQNRCGAPDGGLVGDGGAAPVGTDDGGCGCRATGGREGSSALALCVAMVCLGARRRRRPR